MTKWRDGLEEAGGSLGGERSGGTWKEKDEVRCSNQQKVNPTVYNLDE